MTTKARNLAATSVTHADRVTDRVKQYQASKHLSELTDVIPGHLISRLLDGQNVVLSAIPLDDMWIDDMRCSYCSRPVFLLHSLGMTLILQKDDIGLMASRHQCPKMKTHNGVFLK